MGSDAASQKWICFPNKLFGIIFFTIMALLMLGALAGIIIATLPETGSSEAAPITMSCAESGFLILIEFEWFDNGTDFDLRITEPDGNVVTHLNPVSQFGQLGADITNIPGGETYTANCTITGSYTIEFGTPLSTNTTAGA